MTQRFTFVSSLILENNQQQYLLIQRPASKAYPYQWEFPGGKIEQQETPIEALIREIHEEIGIGIDPTDLTPVTFSSFPYPGLFCTILYFHCQKWTGNIILKEKQPSYDWFKFEEIQALTMPDANHLLFKNLKNCQFPGEISKGGNTSVS